MAKLPFMKFFPNDWLAEPSIRTCSVAARGLWIDMLSLMHLSPRRGYLLAASGLPITAEQLARMTGCSADEANRLLGELRTSGTFSCNSDGMIYSRRMVREESKREKCADAGRRGGGNPTFKGRHKGVPKGGRKGHPKPPEARGQIPEARSQTPLNPPAGDEGGKRSNPLFDAIAEVTGMDPKLNGSQIGTVSAALAGADPPYTPDEVREFGRRFWSLCPWAARDRRERPTVGEVGKWVGQVRSAARPGPAAKASAERTLEQRRAMEAAEAQAVTGPEVRKLLAGFVADQNGTPGA